MRGLGTRREEVCDLNMSASRSRCQVWLVLPSKEPDVQSLQLLLLTLLQQSVSLPKTLWSLDISLCRTLFLRPLKRSVTVHGAARALATADTHKWKEKDKKKQNICCICNIYDNPTVIQTLLAASERCINKNKLTVHGLQSDSILTFWL